MRQMRKSKRPLIRLAGGRGSNDLPIPAILGPLRGLGYIVVMPFVGIAALILLSSYRASRSLATLWRKSTQETIEELKVVGADAADLRKILQPLVDGLECEFVVVDLDLRITQYLTPLSRKNKVLEQTAIGQHCFEVSHGRNSSCDACECECPVTKVLETNNKVTVTHCHENRLEGKGKKRFVNVLALPIRDSQSNITQIAEFIFNTDIATQIVPRVTCPQ
jgi:transcriptional regulator with PAS, ATPase and Fis domain